MIVLDKETDYTRQRFRYYKQHLGGFREIPAGDYPKQIATQNLGMPATDGFRFKAGVKTPIRPDEIARKLDPNDFDFRDSLTAKIWYELVTGKGYFETTDIEIDKAFLEDYLKKYKVERLTGKPAKGQPAQPVEEGKRGKEKGGKGEKGD